jgi:hypothetical protein
MGRVFLDMVNAVDGRKCNQLTTDILQFGRISASAVGISGGFRESERDTTVLAKKFP